MNSLLDQLAAALRALNLRGSRVLLGVSGGADSIALLRGLLEFRSELGFQLVVGHLDHRLRGTESERDKEWLSSLCQSLEVRLVLGQSDVETLAKNSGIGIEEAGRGARYQFLESAATEHKCPFIAVAHTSDDQAETILHHILRGTGIAGLRGIPTKRELTSEISLIRPLLKIARDEIESYLAHIDQDFRQDSSNTDEHYTRNRIRNSLLPQLQREFNPQVRDAILRLGQQAEQTQEALEFISAQVLFQAIQDSSDDIVRLNCQELQQYPRHLIRTCLTLVWKDQNWPRQRMGFADWDRLAQLVAAEGTVVLPGPIEACRRGQLLILRRH